jgi:hypothetical protein
MTYLDINNINKLFPNNKIIPVFKQNDDSLSSILNSIYTGRDYKINGTIEIYPSIFEDLNIKLISGRVPVKSNENYEEIAITKYTYYR